MILRFFLTWGLLAVLLAACAPAATESVAPPPVTVAVEARSTPLVEIPSPTPEADGQSPVDGTATPVVDPQLIATSRGPNLEATDPTTVSLASGRIQFVEFFRFT
jgi:hypothetical protein